MSDNDDNNNNNNNETMKLIEDEVEALNITTERRFADKETFTRRGDGSDATSSSQRLFTPVIEPSANLLVAENAGSSTTITTTKNNNNLDCCYSERPLFGGHITSDLPKDWIDLSDIRPVPDNQECFQSRLVTTDRSSPPQLLVIEILERQEDVFDDDAASFFFKELATQNDALHAEKQTKDGYLFYSSSKKKKKDNKNTDAGSLYPATALANDEYGDTSFQICSGYGFQQVAMGRDHDQYSGKSRRNEQEIKNIRIDIVVLRLPIQETDLVITVSNPVVDHPTNITSTYPNDAIVMPTSETKNPILHRIVSTFQIRDWKLFG